MWRDSMPAVEEGQTHESRLAPARAVLAPRGRIPASAGSPPATARVAGRVVHAALDAGEVVLRHGGCVNGAVFVGAASPRHGGAPLVIMGGVEVQHQGLATISNHPPAEPTRN